MESDDVKGVLDTVMLAEKQTQNLDQHRDAHKIRELERPASEALTKMLATMKIPFPRIYHHYTRREVNATEGSTGHLISVGYESGGRESWSQQSDIYVNQDTDGKWKAREVFHRTWG
jgi:hypothetical protein